MDMNILSNIELFETGIIQFVNATGQECQIMTEI